MPQRGKQKFWWWVLAAIIASGLLSRMMPIGFPLWDKYLGDALYAAMVYVLIRIAGRTRHVALWAAAVMLGIEIFQLTGIPAELLQSPTLAVRLGARLMGTHFSLLDLAAYACGIASIATFDRIRSMRTSHASRKS